MDTQYKKAYKARFSGLIGLITFLFLLSNPVFPEEQIQLELDTGKKITGSLQKITPEGAYVLKTEDTIKRIAENRIRGISRRTQKQQSKDKNTAEIFVDKIKTFANENLSLPSLPEVPTTTDQKATYEYQKGMKLEKTGQFEKARTHFKNAMKVHSLARAALARNLIQDHQYQKGLKILEGLRGGGSTLNEYVFQLEAYTYKQLEKLEKYHLTIQQFIRWNYEGAKQHYAFTHYWLAREDLTRAKTHWKNFIEATQNPLKEPFTVEKPLVRRTKKLFENHKTSKGYQQLNKLSDLNPIWAQSLYPAVRNHLQEMISREVTDQNFQSLDKKLLQGKIRLNSILSKYRTFIQKQRNHLISPWDSYLKVEIEQKLAQNNYIGAVNQLRAVIQQQENLRPRLQTLLKKSYRKGLNSALQKQDKSKLTSFLNTIQEDLDRNSIENIVPSILQEPKPDSRIEDGQLEKRHLLFNVLDNLDFPGEIVRKVRDQTAKLFLQKIKNNSKELSPEKEYLLAKQFHDLNSSYPLPNDFNLISISTHFLKQKQYDRALNTLQILLDQDPNNREAESFRKKIQYHKALQYARSEHSLKDRTRYLKDYLQISRQEDRKRHIKRKLDELKNKYRRKILRSRRHLQKFFPIREGSRYTYSRGDETKTVVWMKNVQKKQEKWIIDYHIQDFQNGNKIGQKTRKLVSTDGAIYFKDGKNQKDILLDLPVRLGKEWKHQSENLFTRRRYEEAGVTVTNNEMTFEGCLKVSVEHQALFTGNRMGSKSVKYEYYAPGVGLVKVEHKDPNMQSQNQFLTSFKIAE